MQRVCALTLDVEADHGWQPPFAWDALAATGPLQALLDTHGAPLTTFATGEALARAAALWGWLEGRGDEIGLHSDSHPPPWTPFDPAEISRAIAAYRARFGRVPGCWRPPYGRLKRGEADALVAAGIRRVSTFGRRHGGPGISDRPVSRVLGMPACLVHLMVLGDRAVARLPTRSVLCLHLHDVVGTTARARLPAPFRAWYALAGRQGDPLAFLDGLLTRLAARGTRFVPLWER